MAESGPLREASRFVDYLLSRPVAAKVAKVFVFGSVVKGEATADSDVDILIVTLNAVGEEIDDALLDFHRQSAAPLEVVTCVLSEILPPMDYFLVNVLRYGKEIYSMPQDEIKRTAARDLAVLARGVS